MHGRRIAAHRGRTPPEFTQRRHDLIRGRILRKEPDYPIGLGDDIIATIKGVVPEADFSDPAWGRCGATATR